MASKSNVLRPQKPEKSGTLSAAEAGQTRTDANVKPMAERREHGPEMVSITRFPSYDLVDFTALPIPYRGSASGQWSFRGANVRNGRFATVFCAANRRF